MATTNRRWRIKANHNNEMPSHFIFAAVEAELINVEKPSAQVAQAYKFKLARVESCRFKGGQWYGHDQSWIERPEFFWAWCRYKCRPKEPTWVIAYNWHFAAQLLGFWNELDAGRLSLTLPRREYIDKEGQSREVKEWAGMLACDRETFVAYCVSPAGCLKLVDVRNYFDVGLDEIGKSFGVGVIPSADDNGPTLATRPALESACNIIRTAMTQTVSEWLREQRGNWQPTAARLAWSNFRHEYIERPEEVERRLEAERAGEDCSIRAKYTITIDNDRMDRELQRRSFYGGQCSHWFLGEYHGEVYKVDCIGLYPFVMQTGLFPVAVHSAWRTDSENVGPATDRIGSTAGRVQVYCQSDLPVRNVEGRVEYPTGIFWTTLCGSELLYASEQNRIRQWAEWECYELAPIFARFIAYWWAIRKQAKMLGNAAQSQLAKMMMNCLYGVFAKRTPNWIIDRNYTAPVQWGYYYTPAMGLGKLVKCRSVAGVVQRMQGQAEREDTFPAISAMIASSGRMYMNRIREALPAKSVLLQQTDSLLLTQAGYDALRETLFWGELALGQFRLVKKMAGVTIAGANHYWSGEDECLAGCSPMRVKVGSNQWRVQRPWGSGEAIHGGPRGEVPVNVETFTAGAQAGCYVYDDDGWARPRF